MNFIRSKFNILNLAWDFIKFFTSAHTADTLDSPALFDFYQSVISKKNESDLCFGRLEFIRHKMLIDDTILAGRSFGAGSKIITDNELRVKDIAKSAVSNSFKCRLLYKVAEYYRATHILELGTSLGITTQYLASTKYCKQLVTVEGNSNVLKIATKNNTKSNITFINSDFVTAQVMAKKNHENFDMIIIDGDHSYEETISNYDRCQALISSNGILIIDDIYWSSGMKEAWKEIQIKNPSKLFIDLFYFGIVLQNQNIKEKQSIKMFPHSVRWKPGLFR